MNLTEDTYSPKTCCAARQQRAPSRPATRACLKPPGDEGDAAKWRAMVAIAELSRHSCTPERVRASY